MHVLLFLIKCELKHQCPRVTEAQSRGLGQKLVYSGPTQRASWGALGCWGWDRDSLGFHGTAVLDADVTNDVLDGF